MAIYTTQEYKGFKVKILSDEDPQNPRDFTFGTMYCISRNYKIGDKHSYDQEALQEIEKDPDNIALPIYGYEHTGLTISVGSFSDRWDSGRLGIIYVSKEDVANEGITHEQATLRLKSEVEVYNQYLTGDVFGFVIEDMYGNEIESCFGFYGTDFNASGLNEQACEIIDSKIDFYTKLNALVENIKNTNTFSKIDIHQLGTGKTIVTLRSAARLSDVTPIISSVLGCSTQLNIKPVNAEVVSEFEVDLKE